MKGYQCIAVAVDSKEEFHTLFHGVKNLMNEETKLVLCSVVDNRIQDARRVRTSYRYNSADEEKEFRTRMLEELKEGLKDVPAAEILTYTGVGNPKRVLTREVNDIFWPDLMVVGYGGLMDEGRRGHRFLIGSITNYVLHYAECDVLVVKKTVN